MEPQNAQTRQEVWSKYYGAEYAFRYYQLLGNSFLKKHNRLRFLTLALGGGAGVAALIQVLAPYDLVGYVLSALGIGLAVISNVNMVGDYARKASIASSISKSCAHITQQLADLMWSIDHGRINEEAARRRLAELSELVSHETFTSEAAGIEVSEDDKLSKEAADTAYSHLEALYAS